MGGSGNYPRQFRVVGCPAILTLFMLTNYPIVNTIGWLMIGLSFGLSIGAISTYWDWLFGYDNFWFHGFAIGLGALPFIWIGISWWIILIRAILLGLSIGIWSLAFGNDNVEELGRGAFIVATLPLII